MEFAGLALAVPPLLFLCLDVLDRVENFRKYEIHEHQLNARFRAAKTRLQKWSNAVGVTKDGLDDSQHKCLHDPIIGPALYDILNALYKTFDDLTEIKQQLAQDGLGAGQAPVGWRPVQRTKSGFRRLRKSMHDKRTALSWALRGKAVFLEQVEMFEILVNGLYDLLPLDQATPDTTISHTPAPVTTIATETEQLRGLLRDMDVRLSHLYTDAASNMYKRLDEWLRSPIDNQDFEKHYSLRVEATCEWILTQESYLQWQIGDLRENKAKLLWIHGPPGFGKTVLCATLTARLIQESSGPVAYFFSSSHVQSSERPVDIVRLWISQLVRADSAIFDLAVEYLMKDHTALIATQKIIWDLLQSILSAVSRCILILDGYDEFPRIDDDRQKFLHKLKDVVASTNTRVLIVSRPQDDIESEISPSHSAENIVMTQCRITPQLVLSDIRLLAAKVVTEQLPRKETSLQQELTDKLSQKCEGQFLWIKLLKPQLRSGKSKRQLWDIVDQTPHGLTQTYERHWSDIHVKPPSDRNRAVAILRWVCFASRPLTIEELTEALIHEPDLEGSCQENMPDEIDNDYVDSEIKGLCPAFLDISDDSTSPANCMVRIIHPSAKEFLRLRLPDPRLSLQHAVVLLPDARPTIGDGDHHLHLAENCLRYINCDHTWESYLTGGQNVQGRFQTGFMSYADDGWYDHKLQAKNLVSDDYDRLTIQLFNPNGPVFSRWANNPRYRAVEWTEPREETGLNAAICLAAFWGQLHILNHFHASTRMDFSPVSFAAGDALSAAAPHGSEMFNELLSWGADPYSRCGEHGSPLGAAVVAGNHNMALELLKLGVDCEVRDFRERTVLALACQNNDLKMIQHLLNHGANPSGQSIVVGSPLFYAINNENAVVVRLLLNCGAKILITDDEEHSYLHYACAHDCPEIVSLLLGQGSGLETRDVTGATPLAIASTGGHTETVRCLLDHGALVDCQDSNSCIPLLHAASQGHLETVCLLLDRGATIDRYDHNGATPLWIASYEGLFEIVHLLLDRGAVVDCHEAQEITPLLAASLQGRMDIVRLLLDRGADIDHQMIGGCTALSFASGNGHLEVVRLLLDEGAIVDYQAQESFLPLGMASFRGHTEIARLLLDRGAAADRQCPEWTTPLLLASSNGHLDIVRLLIDRGAVVDHHAKNFTPLYIASSSGHLEAVRLLLDSGAEVDLQGPEGLTPLCIASLQGNLEIVRLLIDRGALVDYQTSSWTIPLPCACSQGHLEVVRLLLDRGAVVDSQDQEGLSPLLIASEVGQTQTVSLLIERRANVNHQANNGYTALHLAALNGHVQCVQVLLDGGADPNQQAHDNSVPLHHAARGHLTTSRLLLERGAEIAVKAGPELCLHEPLHFAIVSNEIEIVRFIINKGAPVNLRTRWGFTALQIASEGDNIEMIEELLNANADANVVSEGGLTLLQHILRKFSAYRRVSQWEGMFRSDPSDRSRREQTRENICAFAQDLLSYVAHDRPYSLFGYLYEEFKYLDAIQDATFAIKQRLMHKNEFGIVYHPHIHCDGCLNPDPEIFGDRWTCFRCWDRDYCSVCKRNLSNNADAEVRECSKHELILVQGVFDERFTEENSDYHEERAKNPVVRDWLKDVLSRYGAKDDLNRPTDK